MTRSIKVFNGLLHNGILSVMTWRGFMFTLILSQTAAPLLSWAIWSAALPGSATRPYYVVLLLTQLSVACYEQYTTSSSIYSGDFINTLVMPYPVLLNTFSFATAMRIIHLTFASPLLILLFIWAWPFFGTSSLMAIPAILCAILLRFLFGFTLALSAFYTQRAFGICLLGDIAVEALGGSAISLLLPGFMNFARWLPFRYMLGFPAELAAGVLRESDIIFGFTACGLYLLLFSFLTLFIYKKGLTLYKGAEG